MFFTRGLNPLNFLQRVMKVLCLVMIETLVPTIFSRRTPDVLKPCVMRCLMKVIDLKWSDMILMM
jgi:hypothetical protein